MECELQFSKPDAEGWMQTSVTVRVPSFEGAFECAVHIEEWREFVRTLRHLESAIGTDAQASWTNMEGNLALHLSQKKLGALEGRYEFNARSLGEGPSLFGAFEADQTYLQRWVCESQKVLDDFR
jgi:hypothetical protein